MPVSIGVSGSSVGFSGVSFPDSLVCESPEEHEKQNIKQIEKKAGNKFTFFMIVRFLNGFGLKMKTCIFIS